MQERPFLLFVARTGEYLGVLRSSLTDGGASFVRRDGSIGHVFKAPTGKALYALDGQLRLERVIAERRAGIVRVLRARATAGDARHPERTASSEERMLPWDWLEWVRLYQDERLREAARARLAAQAVAATQSVNHAQQPDLGVLISYLRAVVEQ